MGSTKVRTTDLETVLGCGGYQVFIFVLYQLSVFLQCSNMAFMSFGKVAPSRWWCVEEDGNSTSTTSENGTGKWNQTEQCLLYASGACKRYQWETDFRSIVPEVSSLRTQEALEASGAPSGAPTALRGS